MGSHDEIEKLRAVMAKVGRILLEAGRPFALAGGQAVWARGGPDSDHDVDFLIRREDKDDVLARLEEAGMEVERCDEAWLYKAYESGAMVDLIFCAPDGETDKYISKAEVLKVRGLMLPVMTVADVLTMRLLAAETTR